MGLVDPVGKRAGEENLKIHIAWAHGVVYVTETMCKQYSNIVYFGGGVVK